MKRITRFLAVVAAMLLPLGIQAADFDLSGYTLAKTLDFSIYEAEQALTQGDAVETKAWDNGNAQFQTMYAITAPEDYAGYLIVQSVANKGFIIGANSGLYSKGAQRVAAIDGLSKGDIVVITTTQADADNVISIIRRNDSKNKGDYMPDGNYNYVKSEDGKSYYCVMTDDGYVGFNGLNGKQAVSKISIYKPAQGTNLANYTVKFVDPDGNTVKESATYSSAIGMKCTVFPADLQKLTIEDVNYIVASNDAAEQTVAADGSTVVTVTYKAVAPVPYTVYEVAGDITFRTTTGTEITGNTVKVPYRYFNAANGQLYKKTQTNKEFNYSFLLTQENQVEKLEYTAVDGVTNVVFITEGEDIEGLTPCDATGNTGIRSSNSLAAYAAEADTKIVKLSAGTYKIHGIIYDSAKNPDSHWIFKAGEETVADFNCTTVNIQEFDSEEFTLTEATDIILAAGGSKTQGVDALYIVGDGSIVEEAEEVVFDFNAWDVPTSANGGVNDGDITSPYETIVDGVTLYVTNATEGVNTPNRFWSTNKGPQLRMYSGWFSLTAPEGKAIVKAVIENGKWNANNTINGVAAETGEWEGNSTDIQVAIAGNTQINKIIVTLANANDETTTFIEPILDQDIFVNRETGLGYAATTAQVDFTQALEYLGVEELTTDMLRIENADGTIISDYAQFDGWFNTKGIAETWGSLNAQAEAADKAGICVKFFQAIPDGKFEICDMNGADEVGKTYTVRWQLVNGKKSVRYTINVTFVEPQQKEIEVIKTIDVPVEMLAETAYEGSTATFPLDEVVEALGIESINEADQYIVNVTTGEFVRNSTDGWRDANGDAALWADAANGVCVKISDPASGVIDYLGTHDANFQVGDTYTAKWGFVNADNKAVVLNVNITFVAAAQVEKEVVDKGIIATVEYDISEESYTEKYTSITDEQVAAICQELGIQSLADATVYGYNPTTKELIANYEVFDGWRDANGDFHNWAGDATVPACVKYIDGKTYSCYNIAGCEEQTIKCYWAIANEEKAVLVEIDFIYSNDPTVGINDINVNSQTTTVYNLQGQRVMNGKKGLYIINGKKVVLK